jgi:hypothetical protein
MIGDDVFDSIANMCIKLSVEESCRVSMNATRLQAFSFTRRRISPLPLKPTLSMKA